MYFWIGIGLRLSPRGTQVFRRAADVIRCERDIGVLIECVIVAPCLLVNRPQCVISEFRRGSFFPTKVFRMECVVSAFIFTGKGGGCISAFILRKAHDSIQ